MSFIKTAHEKPNHFRTTYFFLIYQGFSSKHTKSICYKKGCFDTRVPGNNTPINLPNTAVSRQRIPYGMKLHHMLFGKTLNIFLYIHIASERGEKVAFSRTSHCVLHMHSMCFEAFWCLAWFCLKFCMCCNSIFTCSLSTRKPEPQKVTSLETDHLIFHHLSKNDPQHLPSLSIFSPPLWVTFISINLCYISGF